MIINKNRGKLFVIEGLDGSGKQTQSELLTKRLKDEGLNVKRISFPNYEDQSSVLAQRYLKGQYSDIRDIIGAENYSKNISSFYAVDRASTFMINDTESGKSLMHEFMYEGLIIICDRYSTSNMLYQPTNFEGSDFNSTKILNLTNWIYQFEHVDMMLPAPDKVLFLDVEPETSIENISKRLDKGVGDEDILENISTQVKVYFVKEKLIEAYSDTWSRIPCSKPGSKEMKSVEDINKILYYNVITEINKI